MDDADNDWLDLMGEYPAGDPGDILTYLQLDQDPQDADAYFRRNFPRSSPRPRRGFPSRFQRNNSGQTSAGSHITQWHRTSQGLIRTDRDAVGAGLWTATMPPSWGPFMADTFPIRRYAVEVSMWEQGTSIPPERRAALCVGQLKGFARTEGERLMCDPVIGAQLKWGAQDLANGQAMSGCTILCWHLLQKYGEYGQHILIRVASELKSFQRQPGESIKDGLQRHEMLLQNAFQHGATHNNILVHSLELLGTFKISKHIIPMLLFHTGGRIPINNAEYNTLRNMLVNWSHLIDGHGPNSVPLTIPYNPREQAFSHGAFPVMTVEDGDCD